MNRLVTIDTDTDAFRHNGWQQEVARVLTQLAARLACCRDTTGTLRDTGGADCAAPVAQARTFTSS